VGWLFPSLRQYHPNWLRGDLVAGLTVWAVLVPESLAYASIAGVSPVVGLYAAPPALLFYALFGSSRHLIVGPMSATAALSAATVADLVAPASQDFAAFTAALAITTGVAALLAGILRLGFLANFISEPVLKGFIIGLALTIIIGQVPGIAVMLVGFAEGLGAAKTYAAREHYEIDADRELIGLGAANVTSGLASGMVVNGSLSKTAVNGGAGAHSQVSGLVVAALTVVTLLFLTGLFEQLPEATLAAVVIAAVIELVDFGALVTLHRVWSVRLGDAYGPAARPDFLAALAALFGVLIFDTLPGLFIGIAVSLILLLYRASRPRVAVLGRVPGTSDQYTDISGARMLNDTAAELRERGITLMLVHDVGQVRDVLRATVGEDPELQTVYPTIAEALAAAMGGRGAVSPSAGESSSPA
jgi:MFS superfamily sulfate permease-like transporter